MYDTGRQLRKDNQREVSSPKTGRKETTTSSLDKTRERMTRHTGGYQTSDAPLPQYGEPSTSAYRQGDPVSSTSTENPPKRRKQTDLPGQAVFTTSMVETTVRSHAAQQAIKTSGTDGLSRAAQKRIKTLGTDGLRRAAQKRIKTLGTDGLRRAAQQAKETLGPDGRSRAAQQAKETLGPDGRSRAAQKRIKTLGTDGLSRAAQKAVETRKANKMFDEFIDMGDNE